MTQNYCIVVDVDNTVADSSHRSHHLEGVKKDWKRFFSECGFDKPIHRNIELINAAYSLLKLKHPNLKIIFLTGRPESVKGETHVWLSGYFNYNFDLMCRPNHLWVPNFEFKASSIEKIAEDNTVLYYFDDDYESCKAVKPFIPNAVVLTVV